MERNLRLAGAVVMLLWVITGCRKHATDETPADPGKSLFVSATSIGTFTKTELQAAAVIKGFAPYVALIKYDVDFYKIIYQTTYKGNKINVSGLLCIPKGVTAAPPLLSAQHGTMFRDADAPSNFPAAFTGFEIFASAGFVTVIPDFIGYGESKDIVHPYYDMQTSGLAVANMLTATKYYLKTQNTAISNKLFIVGYSEGGYVTMAAQREIETNSNHELTLTAAAEGAGGYDVSGMLSQVATVSAYPDPSFFALFIQGYNTTYNYNRPLTDYFSQPYAGLIPSLLDGSKTSDQINSALTTSPAALFSPAFYSSLTSSTAEATFKAQVAANSFPAWYPKSPTRMYHGTADEDVFFSTSQSTYNKFITAGSKQLTFIPIPNATHETGVAPMMLNALQWFQSLSQ